MAPVLPRWKSHKEVYADKITQIIKLEGHDDILRSDDSGYTWLLESLVRIYVSKSLIARGAPQVGDYFIQYDDGYQSWSPAKAFEDGYVRLT